MRGLAAGDFTVTVAGQPRRVVSAEFVDSLAETSRSNLRRSSLESMISTNEGAGIGRLFVFVVDQGTLEPGNVRHVGQAASRFLATLTFADRSALMLLPSGPNVTFTWAHDRVRDALGRVIGQAGHDNAWEFGSLTEARDIANRSLIALRTSAQRECGSGAAAIGRIRRASAAAPVGLGPARSTPAGGGGGGRAVRAPAAAGRRGGGGAGGTGGSQGSAAAAAAGVRAAAAVGGGGFGNSCTRDLQMRAEWAWRGVQMTSLTSINSLRQLLAALDRGARRQDRRPDLGRLAARRPRTAHADHDRRQRGGGRARDALHALRAQHDRLGQPADDHLDARQRQLPALRPARHARQHDRRRVVPRRGRRRSASSIVSAASCPASTASASRRTPRDADGKGAADEGAGRAQRRHGPGPRDLRRAHLRRSRLGGAPRRTRSRRRSPRPRSACASPAISPPIPTTPSASSWCSPARPRASSRAKRRCRSWSAISTASSVLAGEQPVGEPRGDGLVFTANVPVAPGSYVVRVAVIDGAGRVGSVDHRIDAHRAVARRHRLDRRRCCCACRRAGRGEPASRSTPSRRTSGWPSRSISTASGRSSKPPPSTSTSPPRPTARRSCKASGNAGQQSSRARSWRRASATCACCRPAPTSRAPTSGATAICVGEMRRPFTLKAALPPTPRSSPAAPG